MSICETVNIKCAQKWMQWLLQVWQVGRTIEYILMVNTIILAFIQTTLLLEPNLVSVQSNLTDTHSICHWRTSTTQITIYSNQDKCPKELKWKGKQPHNQWQRIHGNLLYPHHMMGFTGYFIMNVSYTEPSGIFSQLII